MSRGMKPFLIVSLILFVSIGLIALSTAVHGGSTTSAVPRQLPPATQEEKARARVCERTLDKIQRDLWMDMKQSGDIVTVITAPGFQRATYEDRKSFTALTVCYFDEGRANGTVSMIEFLDPYTHESFGHWYKGTELKFSR